MATLEDEIRDLKEKNNELVQKVQYWKVAAASKENEKLELMKEINELRLKLSRIRSGGAAQARKLDAALQSSSEEALTHLVQASSAVARTIELAKTYMQDRQDLDNESPRWSAIGGTPNSERVHRVPPLLIGGQSIQPVVSLSRTLLNTSSSSLSRSLNISRSPNQNRSVTERAVPMHMLQDVYIPLTRIDVSEFPGNSMETENENNDLENSAEDLGLEDSGERSAEDSQIMSGSEDFESSRRLEAVTEDLEPEDIDVTPPRPRTDNPLEGPSWLLDRPSFSHSRQRTSKNINTLEPDSTTQLDERSAETPPLGLTQINEHEGSMVAPAFSPTVRRRKRTASPPHVSRRAAPTSPDVTASAFSPRPAAARRNSNSGRILKVLVAKMRLDSDSDSDDATPPKRHAPSSPVSKRLSRELVRESPPTKKLMRFDAPSPNGATDARVIVLEQTQSTQADLGSGEPMPDRRDGRVNSRDARRQRRDPDPSHAKMACGDGHTHTKGEQNRLADEQSTDNAGSDDSDQITQDNDRSASGSHRIVNVELKTKDTNRKRNRLANEQSGDRVGSDESDQITQDNDRSASVSHRMGIDSRRIGNVELKTKDTKGKRNRLTDEQSGDRAGSDDSDQITQDNDRTASGSHRIVNVELKTKDTKGKRNRLADEQSGDRAGSDDSDQITQDNDRSASVSHRMGIEVKTEENRSNVSKQISENDRSGRPGNSDNLSRIGSTGDHTSRLGSVGPEGSDSSTEHVGEGRTRRPRKQVIYKEKPLNRKLRR